MSQLILPGIIQRGTLHESLEWMIAHALVGREPSTIGLHRQRARWLCDFFGGATPLEFITYERLCRFVESMGPCGRGQMYGTIRKTLNTLRMALREAIKRELLDDLPPWPTMPNDMVPGSRVATADEMAALRAEFGHTQTHVRWLDVAYRTGMRFSDVNRAVRGHFDLRRMTFLRISTKTKKKWPAIEMPLHPELALTIEVWDALEQPRPEWPVGGRWSKVVRDLACACLRLGIPRIGPNDIRRTCESDMAAKGATPEFRALFFGHSTAVAEKHYTRATPALLDAGRKAMVG